MNAALKQNPQPHALGVGEQLVLKGDHIIQTVLGSCVSVCIFSIQGTVGGMNHFVMPSDSDVSSRDAHLHHRYGNFSMTSLLESILSVPGVKRQDLRAKIIGGADKTGGGVVDVSVGSANVAMAKKMLTKYGIQIVGEDVGGAFGRTVLFYTQTGRVRVAPVVPKNLAKIAAVDAPRKPAALPKKKRVLIVDDSKTIQGMLKAIFSKDDMLEVVGVADNPIEAEKILKQTAVDVMTLDIQMPIMDGVTFLDKIMREKPMPVVMITAMSMQEGDQVMRALELGAVDYIQKPKMNDLAEVSGEMCEMIRVAADAKIMRERSTVAAVKREEKTASTSKGRVILAIGASTGGTEAIKRVLTNLTTNVPPIVIVQHIPAGFSRAFANRLNDLCKFDVKEAEHGDRLRPGLALIAPGGKNMRIVPDGLGYKIAIADDEAVNRHKPSVDVLFDSVAKHAKDKAVGVILTGMGRDGADGLLKMRKQNCFTIAQDEASCVVYGMPKCAVENGAAQKVTPLTSIPAILTKHFRSIKS